MIPDRKKVNILLVEDNPGDVRLTEEAFKYGKLVNNLYVVSDGVRALQFLRNEGEYTTAPRPDLILLDLNLPRKDGREVLIEIKNDKKLRTIPVIVLTTSEDEADILKCYHSHANCYINKPIDFEKFISVIRTIEGFWLSIVRLPNK